MSGISTTPRSVDNTVELVAERNFDLALLPYKAHLEAALAYADMSHTFEDVVALVASGAAQAWPGPASIIITEIVTFPRWSVLNFFLAAGRMSELQAMTPHILDWAKAHGCTRATLVGRKGWARSFLTSTGWREKPVRILECAL